MTSRCSTKAADAKVERIARTLAGFFVRGLEGCTGAWDYPSLPERERERITRAANAVLAALEVADPRQDRGFQARVSSWMDACFTPEIKADRLERCDRFIEESLELVQTEPTFTVGRAHALVDYVFGRAVGEADQEVGGVLVTLAALCGPFSIDMAEAGEREITRISAPETIEKIRAKQAAKPAGSALPIAMTKAMRDTPTEAMIEAGCREAKLPVAPSNRALVSRIYTAMQAARSEIPVQDDVCRTCQGRGYVWVTPARSRIREREQCSDCTGIPVQDDDAGIIHALKIARKELLREHQGVDFGREARCRVVIERIDEALASIGREAIP